MDSGSPQGLLVRAVTHELRQELVVIVGHTELLAMRPRTEEAERAATLAAIRRAGARMVGVLCQLDSSEELLNPGPPGSEPTLAAQDHASVT